MPFKLQGTECFDSNDVMSYILGVCQEKVLAFARRLP